ncbi:MAG TPA: response regulator [Acidimicrobiales bacterium]|nr:response regulator [Acidimicrobiales bacterium]
MADDAGIVLVVESDISVAEHHSSTLGSAGFDAVIVRRGDDALDMVHRRDDVRAVVTGMVLRGLDGLSLATAIRASAGRPSDLPVVVCSRVGGALTRRRALQVGVDEFVPAEAIDDVAPRVLDLVALSADERRSRRVHRALDSASR